MDVFRNARTHPEKVNWNKVHYAIRIDPNNKNALIMYGSLKDSEHWIKEILDRFKTAEILTYDKKKSG